MDGDYIRKQVVAPAVRAAIEIEAMKSDPRKYLDWSKASDRIAKLKEQMEDDKDQIKSLEKSIRFYAKEIKRLEDADRDDVDLDD